MALEGTPPADLGAAWAAIDEASAKSTACRRPPDGRCRARRRRARRARGPGPRPSGLAAASSTHGVLVADRRCRRDGPRSRGRDRDHRRRRPGSWCRPGRLARRRPSRSRSTSACRKGRSSRSSPGSGRGEGSRSWASSLATPTTRRTSTTWRAAHAAVQLRHRGASRLGGIAQALSGRHSSTTPASDHPLFDGVETLVWRETCRRWRESQARGRC